MKRKRRQESFPAKVIFKKTTVFARHPWIRYPIWVFSILFLMGVISIFILSRNLPSLDELEQAGDPLLVSRIYSADGIVLDELYAQKRIKVPLDRMPEHLRQAVLAYEDRKFYDHWGVDLRRIMILTFQNVTSLSIQGGASTLTQQLARKLYLTPKQSYIRKLREQLTALQIERTYSKDEILEMYLNQMEYGRGAHGVQAASQAWFGKNVEDITIEESALLIGLLQRPYGYYSPDRDSVAAVARRNIILRSMIDGGFLSTTAYDSLGQLELSVIDRDDSEQPIAPYFCEYIRQLMQEEFGYSLYTDGLSIYTTLDTRIQACADSAINGFLPGFEKGIRDRMIAQKTYLEWLDPPLEDPEEIAAFVADSVKVDSLINEKATVQTALVSLDPTNGHILAWVGGRDFNVSKFNRVNQMQRQPGSAFKPFGYTAAIDNGWTTITEILNQPVVLTMVDGSEWRPPNYDGSTGGLTTLREGLYRSLNMVAARLVQELITPQMLVHYTEQFGLTTEIHPFDATILGSDVVIPLEITSAYSVFANRGVRAEPIAILRIEDRDGNVIHEAVPRQREVISEQTAYVMTDMLQSVLNEARGTGHSARLAYHFYRPAGGKTGTTNDFRNAWFIGFTPQIATGVWIGFDDERITLGEGKSGAVAALPIWAPFMKMAHDTLRLPLKEFVQPPGVVRVKICSESKKIATVSCPKVWDEIFKEDTVPTDPCEMHLSSIREEEHRNTGNNRVVF
ncbi:PBP1A family penicillin-binding protein [bacterium]|nr:PBP1A family penicillin-binding protein [bacterium]